MVWNDYLPKKSLLVVGGGGGRPNLMLAQVQVLDLLELTWDLTWT